ncbi:hypothetical protein BBF96_13040 [Anoxybacter fermentans]|uniref:Endonuclease NucS C-terminal domain-containing protein n=1 Tax=Anoxybacter fermentans TaxID=1323375 RepID=A0A3Q9HS14_9FIRM|nr:endonuclease NucS domain-containing protein [Anoxybacter fermentans]AZR74242.1 hypothetical protein BBF96_13040 [Anoxybacter fermentans]
MLEEDLKRIVCLHPEIIEDGLKVEQEEYPIKADRTTYRCDLKCKDKNDKTVFIELKLNAGKNVVYQIAKYKTFLKESGRYMVVAFEFDDETEKVLKVLGFETRKINLMEVEKLLNKERNNPKLYQRKSNLIKNVNIKTMELTHSLYSNEEKEIVKFFMNTLKQIVEENMELTMGFEVEDLDIRKKDEYRLLLKSSEFPSDRLVVYNRARKREEIHLMFVPDFSFNTGSTDKKKHFEEFIIERKEIIEEIFDLPLFKARQKNKLDNRLEITCQAWKGFSRVYVRDLMNWNHPDFIEMVSRSLFDFIESIVPIVRDFYNTYNLKS